MYIQEQDFNLIFFYINTVKHSKSKISGRHEALLLKCSPRDIKVHRGWNKAAAHMPGNKVVPNSIKG